MSQSSVKGLREKVTKSGWKTLDDAFITERKHRFM
jgi:hypothetical protein